MRHPVAVACFVLIAACAAAASRGATCGCGHASCTGAGPCPECVPTCTSSWEEKKVKKPKYSMQCDYLCERARESWHTGPAECRCSPPCGEVFVKKKLYKREEEKVERVPKYEVRMVPAPCDYCLERPCRCPHWYDLRESLCRLFGW